MLADRIKKVLEKRPYWGPRTVAKELGTTYGAVRTTASKNQIKFMDRSEVEAEMNRWMDAVAKFSPASDDGTSE